MNLMALGRYMFKIEMLKCDWICNVPEKGRQAKYTGIDLFVSCNCNICLKGELDSDIATLTVI